MSKCLHTTPRTGIVKPELESTFGSRFPLINGQPKVKSAAPLFLPEVCTASRARFASFVCLLVLTALTGAASAGMPLPHERATVEGPLVPPPAWDESSAKHLVLVDGQLDQDEGETADTVLEDESSLTNAKIHFYEIFALNARGDETP